jgi:hypothetical protein
MTEERIEGVDRIIESLDLRGGRIGPPMDAFALPRNRLRECLLLAYNNGRLSMRQEVLDQIQRR